MAKDKVQLSVWASATEAEQIRAAATGSRRSVSQWLLIAALEKAQQQAEEVAA